MLIQRCFNWDIFSRKDEYSMSIFLLIRHGNSEAVDYLAGRHPGINLSNSGKQQVKELVDSLSHVHIDMIFSSPIERTMQTAKQIAESKGLLLESSEAFTEFEVGEWTGKTFRELEPDQRWKLFHEFRAGTKPPLGELILEVQSRFVTELIRLRQLHPEKTIAIVSHGDPIRSAICYFTGIPLNMMFNITVGTASVSTLEINDWGATLHTLNHKGLMPVISK